ncbi:hypothetical protein T8K17_06405 [Thalassobaculum sp. OXR-137]|uniref:hypothetical protein n=1 Tax=Thalassobaculum sp. OXR-137 TaxID=3100173 RepID=UPI002AC95D11|nr:hypothetical protein [Thalassobaculum sp. OXR-137]WPZ35771.1 hypothetical protein T8K17_06405 [Thalassobaculum sp. OXR-137]
MADDVTCIHVIFDLERERLTARKFLHEMAEQNWPVQVTGASKREDLDPRAKEVVVTERMRAAKIGLVLVTPMSGVSRNVNEEVKFAKRANLNLVGVLLAGSTAHTNLPEGLHRSRVVGWDWGALKKELMPKRDG